MPQASTLELEADEREEDPPSAAPAPKQGSQSGPQPKTQPEPELARPAKPVPAVDTSSSGPQLSHHHQHPPPLHNVASTSSQQYRPDNTSVIIQNTVTGPAPASYPLYQSPPDPSPAQRQSLDRTTSACRRRANLLRRTWNRLRDRSSPDVSTHRTTTNPKMPSKTSNTNGSGGGQVSHRLRNLFRITSSGSSGTGNGAVAGDKEKEKEKEKDKDKDKTTSNDGDAPGSGSIPTRPFRGRFFTSTVGRLRSQTVASEGNQLQDALSPTASANPYFAHQGMPGLRHHNESSVPPSPPDTPTLKISSPDGTVSTDQATAETKEELARRLRRVASAPNAQGLFKASEGTTNGKPTSSGERPATAELGKDPLIEGSLSAVESKSQAAKVESLGGGLADDDTLSSLPLPAQGRSFRRTYSSNSIKVRTVEVNPASFDKVKLIGKGDVGKVYLVREKKSSRLYAMKGIFWSPFFMCRLVLT